MTSQNATQISLEDFVEEYPEFTGITTGRFSSACSIAYAIGSDWAGLEVELRTTANKLLIAHTLTVLLDGSSPITSYDTKESKISFDTKSRNKPNETLNFHLSDYGIMLNDLLSIGYFGVM